MRKNRNKVTENYIHKKSNQLKGIDNMTIGETRSIELYLILWNQ